MNRSVMIVHVSAEIDEARASIHIRGAYALIHALQQDAGAITARVELNRIDGDPRDLSRMMSDIDAARADASEKEREIIRLERIHDAILDATGTDPEMAQMGRETLRTHAPEMARRLGMDVDPPHVDKVPVTPLTDEDIAF